MHLFKKLSIQLNEKPYIIAVFITLLIILWMMSGGSQANEQVTEQKVVCYTVAMGLCQIALDDPDMVYEIGLSVAEIENKKKDVKKNGHDNLLNISEWRKKLN